MPYARAENLSPDEREAPHRQSASDSNRESNKEGEDLPISLAGGWVFRSALAPSGAMLQPLHAVELAERAVERPEWRMAGLARDLDDEAIGETEGRSPPEVIERRCHNV